ncbi:GNAT family N-acetyltransferase [Enterovibrio paralichthyis]|uniref:GNAT family N-acetyltransferase n=1 Tax=Enterovibrio paralichthyis TaxID=2853805 RepID=UPI001C456CF5|nr:GNAT family N-acetyltransferase [Enterovibrio paralichthyis]MBV7298981.1 GNAT family N-acetyltransferase [Enterovibrio paralichthyis]
MPVTVRPAEPRDIPAIQQLYSCPNAQAGTLQLPLPSLALWEKRLSNLPDDVYCLVAEEDGKVVGQLGFEANRRARRRHVGEFGMAVHDDHTGKGVASALLSAMVDLADNWLNLRRIELTVYSDNDAAIALYQKFGFRQEGVAVDYAFRNGKYVDALFMARLNKQ